MAKITMLHKLGNKILEYDVDDRGVIIDEREKDTSKANCSKYTLAPKSYHNRYGLIGTFEDYKITITSKIRDYLELVWTPNGEGAGVNLKSGETLVRPAFTIKAEGFTEDLKWDIYESLGGLKGNGVFEIPEYTYSAKDNLWVFLGITFSLSLFENQNLVFTILPQKCN